jgi:hypothetical protein
MFRFLTSTLNTLSELLMEVSALKQNSKAAWPNGKALDYD